MSVIVNLYSDKKGEIFNFLKEFYESNKDFHLENDLKWEKTFENPIEIADIIGTFIDNNDSYKINMWISLDESIFINVTNNNVDQIIRYLFERYPY